MALTVETGAEFSKRSGIYAITNVRTGKCYVGSAVDLRNRRTTHLSRLRIGNHHSPKLQASWNKHGPDAFVFSVLEYCAPDQLLTREQAYLDERNSCAKGYNCLPTAGSNLGVKRSAEFGRQVSLRQLGKKCGPLSAEHRARISESLKGNKRTAGYKHTDAARAKMRARVYTPEQRAAMSARLIGHKRSVGVKHTEETRAKVSVSLKGNKRALGLVHSEEARARMSAALKGRPKSPEHSAKIAEALRRSWIRRRAA